MHISGRRLIFMAGSDLFMRPIKSKTHQNKTPKHCLFRVHKKKNGPKLFKHLTEYFIKETNLLFCTSSFMHFLTKLESKHWDKWLVEIFISKKLKKIVIKPSKTKQSGILTGQARKKREACKYTNIHTGLVCLVGWQLHSTEPEQHTLSYYVSVT